MRPEESYLNTFWLNGGVIYGIPPGSTHPFAWERTMDMLDFAVTHLLEACVGPRFLAGDWNFEPHQVRSWDTLKSAGWIEIQDLWERISGIPPVNTCKSKTRKDFLWISPELARHFVALDFSDDFADHSTLRATFVRNHSFADRWLWPKPSPIDWTQVPDIPCVIDFTTIDPSDQYQALWNSREAQAKTSLGTKWNPRMAGRAVIRAPQFRTGWPTPLKKGRSNDTQPNFHGASVLHSRWFEQLRRLQNYHRWANSHTSSS